MVINLLVQYSDRIESPKEEECPCVECVQNKENVIPQ